MKATRFRISFLLLLMGCAVMAQSTKPKSYIISKQASYTMELKNNKPSVLLFSEERNWIGDKDDNRIKGDRIDFTSAFEQVSDIQAYSISPKGKKERVRDIYTQDVEIESIFYHDMKFRYFQFNDLEEGSETYCSYKKEFNTPQLLDNYYFKDNIDCRSSKITLKVAKNIEIGYVLQGNETDKIVFTQQSEGNYNLYSWQLTDAAKEEYYEDAPSHSYFSPHLIFYIKNYKAAEGIQEVLGSVDNLYNFYYKTIKGINKADQTALRQQTEALVQGLTTDAEKARAIFDFVQGKVNYVAFEDGMGGFIPREAADVFQKKYGDCKDMANLLNEMMHYAGIECYIAWIGTRHNNYTYEKVPTPIVDNHMIAVAKIDNEYVFLDATGQYTLFPGFTPFIQGKQALLKIDETHHAIVQVPVIPAEKNNTTGRLELSLQDGRLSGKIDFQLNGFMKSQFMGQYKYSTRKEDMLREYFARFIQNLNTSGIEIKNDDLTQHPLDIQCAFSLEKWVKQSGSQLLFRPVLFFPYSDSRVDTDKRKVPLSFDFKKSYNFEYELTIPEGYTLEFKPDNFNYTSDLVKAGIDYTLNGNKLLVSQRLAVNTLLLEQQDFESWNTAIKTITKQYNQNIILTKIN